MHYILRARLVIYAGRYVFYGHQINCIMVLIISTYMISLKSEHNILHAGGGGGGGGGVLKQFFITK
jgi:hypothetical protein